MQQVANPPPSIIPLRERPLDYVFIGFMIMFALFSFFGDSTPATGGPKAEHWWFMKPVIYHIYAVGKDPLVLDSPVFVRVACFFAAFIFGPFQLVVAYAFWKGKNWIRTPGLVYCGALFEGSMIFVWAEWFGDKQFFDKVCPGVGYDFQAINMPWVMAFNIWYITIPLLLIWRLWGERPFDRKLAA